MAHAGRKFVKCVLYDYRSEMPSGEETLLLQCKKLFIYAIVHKYFCNFIIYCHCFSFPLYGINGPLYGEFGVSRHAVSVVSLLRILFASKYKHITVLFFRVLITSTCEIIFSQASASTYLKLLFSFTIVSSPFGHQTF